MTQFTYTITFPESILEFFPIEELISGIQQAFQNISEKFPGIVLIAINFEDLTMTVVVDVDDSLIPPDNQQSVVKTAAAEITKIYPSSNVNVINNSTGDPVPVSRGNLLIFGALTIAAIILISQN